MAGFGLPILVSLLSRFLRPRNDHALRTPPVVLKKSSEIFALIALALGILDLAKPLALCVRVYIQDTHLFGSYFLHTDAHKV